MPASSFSVSTSAYRTPADGNDADPPRTLAVQDERPVPAPPVADSLGYSPLSEDLAQSWLAWQCRMVAGIIRGVIYVTEEPGVIGPSIAAWPGPGEGDSQLTSVASQVLKDGNGMVRGQVHYGPDDRRTCDLIACPLMVDQAPVGVVSLMLSTRSKSQQHAVLQLIQWGGLWMETLVRQNSASRHEVGTFTQAMMTSILGASDPYVAAMETVNRLADRFGCERVSMGLRQGLYIRLKAFSRVASFDPRTQLVRGIEAAMEEAVDQAVSLVYPETSQQGSTARAHAELAEQQGNGAMCTVPLPGRAGYIGAITLEREGSAPFDEATVEWLGSLVTAIGLALELKLRDKRPLWSKAIELLRELVATVIGPTHLKLKLIVLTAVLLIGVLAITPGTHVVTAPAGIEGAVHQVLVAPQDGYVKRSEARAGDLVKEGQLIAELDDRQLLLEQQKWRSERTKIDKEYQQALAQRERSKLSILLAQIERVDAELRLVEEKLDRTQLRAPFDGLVVSGDLSQSLGAPLAIGQVLFEVTPLHGYRVVLEVDEHDVAGLVADKTGQMIVAALPQEPFALTISQVIPVAISGEGYNFFRVEASLGEPSSSLRPGMRGVAKVAVGQRSLLWIWTHGVIDRVRLWVWSRGL